MTDQKWRPPPPCDVPEDEVWVEDPPPPPLEDESDSILDLATLLQRYTSLAPVIARLPGFT